MQKYAIITGAGSGIGLATAHLLLSKEWDVIAIGRSQEKLSSLKESYGQRVITFSCDITSKDDIDHLVQDLKKHGLINKVRALVNNAGLWKRESFVKSDDELWNSMFQTNVLGSVRLTREIVQAAIQNKISMSIVNISSTLGIRPVTNTSAYSATKAAMISWTQTLALEVAPHQIRVNCICPGIVDTPIHPAGTLDGLEKAQPLERIGKPEDVAAGVMYLVSEGAEWVTGTVLNIDGGISLL